MAENIYLFVPNLIGYARVIAAFASFYYMPFAPLTAVSLYLLSELLDAFDGHAARALNQASKFGAVLDMLTDRCCTTCLLVVLASFYPKWQIVFQFLICLDITSHWAQMYSRMMTGSVSHKSTKSTDHALLRLYYTSRPVLFLMCAGNELFFAMLYMMHFGSGPAFSIGSHQLGLWSLIAFLSFPICVVKNAINLIQMIGSFETIVEQDKIDRVKNK